MDETEVTPLRYISLFSGIEAATVACDYKGIGNQDIGDGKLICQQVTS